MATLKCREIRSNLQKKGFKESKGDHYYLTYYIDGKKSMIRTKVSHGMRDIGDDLISKMARQTKLNNAQFIKLVTCTLSGDEYYEIVKDLNM